MLRLLRFIRRIDDGEFDRHILYGTAFILLLALAFFSGYNYEMEKMSHTHFYYWPRS